MLSKVKFSIVAIFLVIIIIPFIQKEFNAFHYKSLDENRVKLKPPEGNMLHLFSHGNEYAKKYESYFNDTYGMRDFMIKLKNQVDYSVFGVSDELIIGRDDWLYYRSVVEREQYEFDRKSDAEFQVFYTQLMNFNNYLKQKGTTLIVLPAPVKNTIYPEYLNDNRVKRPQVQTIDKINAFLKEHPEIVSVNAKEILLNAKKENQVFYKTDFHWNFVGAYYITKEIANKIAQIENKPIVWPDLQLQHKPEFSGGQNNSLATFNVPLEDDPAILGWEQCGDLKMRNAPYELSYTATDKCKGPLLPNTVSMGNSYANFFFHSTGFLQKFNSIQFLHLDKFKENMANVPPGTKYFILEFIETNNYLFDKNFWPEMK